MFKPICRPSQRCKTCPLVLKREHLQRNAAEALGSGRLPQDRALRSSRHRRQRFTLIADSD